MCGMSERVEALAFKVWRDYITSMIHTADFQWHKNNSVILRQIEEKLTHFEDEVPKLKEATSILELAVWKMKINEKSHQDMTNQSQKIVKTDESSFQQLLRVTCGAAVVIGHVLPYLMTVADD
jgi:hypothetical protein